MANPHAPSFKRIDADFSDPATKDKDGLFFGNRKKRSDGMFYSAEGAGKSTAGQDTDAEAGKIDHPLEGTTDLHKEAYAAILLKEGSAKTHAGAALAGAVGGTVAGFVGGQRAAEETDAEREERIRKAKAGLERAKASEAGKAVSSARDAIGHAGRAGADAAHAVKREIDKRASVEDIDALEKTAGFLSMPTKAGVGKAVLRGLGFGGLGVGALGAAAGTGPGGQPGVDLQTGDVGGAVKGIGDAFAQGAKTTKDFYSPGAAPESADPGGQEAQNERFRKVRERVTRRSESPDWQQAQRMRLDPAYRKSIDESRREGYSKRPGRDPSQREMPAPKPAPSGPEAQAAEGPKGYDPDKWTWPEGGGKPVRKASKSEAKAKAPPTAEAAAMAELTGQPAADWQGPPMPTPADIAETNSIEASRTGPPTVTREESDAGEADKATSGQASEARAAALKIPMDAKLTEDIPPDTRQSAVDWADPEEPDTRQSAVDWADPKPPTPARTAPRPKKQLAKAPPARTATQMLDRTPASDIDVPQDPSFTAKRKPAAEPKKIETGRGPADGAGPQAEPGLAMPMRGDEGRAFAEVGDEAPTDDVALAEERWGPEIDKEFPGLNPEQRQEMLALSMQLGRVPDEGRDTPRAATLVSGETRGPSYDAMNPLADLMHLIPGQGKAVAGK